MNNDDWDSVSNDTPPGNAANARDAVSAPQPSRKWRIIPDNLVLDNSITPEEEPQAEEELHVTPSVPPHQEKFKASPRRQMFISAPFLRKAAIFGGVVLLLLASSLGVFQGISIHNAHVAATATAETEATVFATHVNGTATAQAVATATALQQIYAQATSGTPAVDDPLSDNRNSWGVFTTDWGGQCAFTGGAYHLTLSKQGYVLFCTSGMISHFDNFALQVNITPVRGDYASIVFGQNTKGDYSTDIHSDGEYALYDSDNNNQANSTFLIRGYSPAIKQGLNQTNVITIIVSNNQLYFYVNQQLLMSYYLSKYVAGTVDLAVVSLNQAPVDIAYSNLKVWSVP